MNNYVVIKFYLYIYWLLIQLLSRYNPDNPLNLVSLMCGTKTMFHLGHVSKYTVDMGGNVKITHDSNLSCFCLQEYWMHFPLV